MLDAVTPDEGPDLIECRHMNAPLRVMPEQALISSLEEGFWSAIVRFLRVILGNNKLSHKN